MDGMDGGARYRRPTWRDAVRDFPWWKGLGVDWRGAPEHPRRVPALPRLLRYYLPYWPTVSAILGLLVVSAAVGVISPLVTRQIIDQALPKHNLVLLAHLLVVLLALHLLGEALGLVHTALHSLTLQGVLRDVRARVFGAMAGTDLRRRAELDPNAVTSRIINDIGIAGTGGVAGVLTTLIGAFHDITVLAASVVAMFVLNPWLAWIVWLVMPPFIVLGLAMGRWVYGLERRLHERIVDLNTALEAAAAAGSAAVARRGAFHRIADAFANVSIARRFVRSSFSNLWSVGTALVAAGLWWFGGREVMNGVMTLGTLLAFIAYTRKVERPMDRLLGVFIGLRGVLALADRVFSLVDHLTALGGPVLPPPTRGLRGFTPMLRPRQWFASLQLQLRVPDQKPLGQTVRRLITYFRPYWPYWVLVAAMAVIAIGGLGQLRPLLERMIIDAALPQHRTGLLLLGVLGILAYPIIHVFTGTVSTLSHEVMSERSLRDLRNDFFDEATAKGPAFWNAIHPSEFTSRGLNDIDAIHGATSSLVDIIWREIPVITASILTFALNWRLGLVAFALIPPFLPWTYIFGRVRYSLDRRIYEEVTRMHQAVQGVAAGRADADPATFHEANQRLADLAVLSSLAAWAYGVVYGLKSLATTLWFWWVGGQWVMGGQLPLGTLMAEHTYAGHTENLGNVFGAYVTLSGLAANCDRVFKLMDAPDPGYAAPLYASH